MPETQDGKLKKILKKERRGDGEKRSEKAIDETGGERRSKVVYTILLASLMGRQYTCNAGISHNVICETRGEITMRQLLGCKLVVHPLTDSISI